MFLDTTGFICDVLYPNNLSEQALNPQPSFFEKKVLFLTKTYNKKHLIWDHRETFGLNLLYYIYESVLFPSCPLD